MGVVKPSWSWLLSGQLRTVTSSPAPCLVHATALVSQHTHVQSSCRPSLGWAQVCPVDRRNAGPLCALVEQ